ncbi:MAG: cytochrome c biosis protein CcmG, thiol:disulfide interchange protein DsbE [Actinomycetota bacterium]|jgi:cytochrome c biogenesis protein CcmG/thiol:disulfide interchange protein DsbE|nr:cytochrome c biosis protein CcmG, thiol:disulfide interchange protein DsbE [Actinomycetota bacterium]
MTAGNIYEGMVPSDELERPHKASIARRLLLGSLVVIVVGALLAFGLRRAPVQKLAPAFTLRRLDGQGTISSASLKGTPLVVNFFASWCVPCREEAPLLERAWQKYKSRGIHFIGVNVTDTTSSAREFVRKYGITYPVVTDYSLSYAQRMKVPGLPITYFIGRDGRFLSTAAGKQLGVKHSGTTVLGAISFRELQKGADALLAR